MHDDSVFKLARVKQNQMYVNATLNVPSSSLQMQNSNWKNSRINIQLPTTVFLCTVKQLGRWRKLFARLEERVSLTYDVMNLNGS